MAKTVWVLCEEDWVMDISMVFAKREDAEAEFRSRVLEHMDEEYVNEDGEMIDCADHTIDECVEEGVGDFRDDGLYIKLVEASFWE